MLYYAAGLAVLGAGAIALFAFRKSREPQGPRYRRTVVHLVSGRRIPLGRFSEAMLEELLDRLADTDAALCCCDGPEGAEFWVPPHQVEYVAVERSGVVLPGSLRREIDALEVGGEEEPER